MKIMTTNHISDKCIFPYVNNKSLLWRMWHLSSHGSITVFSLCSECASWPVPTVLSYYKNVYKAFHVSSQCPHIKDTFQIVFFFICEGEVDIYIRFSLCVMLPPPSINNLHKNLYILTAGCRACFWRDVHIEKKEATYREVDLYKVSEIQREVVVLWAC